MIQRQVVRSPVLLITYRRSKNIKGLIDKLISLGFNEIYIYSNSWKDEQKDKKGVENTREIILNYSKNYMNEIKTNFSKLHLPVDKSITFAIDWFFSKVSQGIILEDDIHISNAGLDFLTLGLEYYKNHKSIASISAFTEHAYKQDIEAIFPRFSYMFHSWGWATWKKIWVNFDHLDSRNYVIDYGHKIFTNKSLARRFQKVLENCKKRRIVTWDYQFQNFCLINNFLNIMPEVPLIINNGIGDKFSENCSEMSQTGQNFLEKEKLDLFSNIEIKISETIDLNFEKELFIFLNKYPSFMYKLINKIRNING